MTKNLLQQALDALNSGNFLERTAAVRVLEEALAQPEQTATSCVCARHNGFCVCAFKTAKVEPAQPESKA